MYQNNIAKIHVQVDAAVQCSSPARERERDKKCAYRKELLF